jgi:pilus assembly protein Flp/PilA
MSVGGPPRLTGAPAALSNATFFSTKWDWQVSSEGEHKMQDVLTQAKHFLRNEDGATMVEYALMLALIAVVCIVAVGTIGTDASAMFSSIADDL